MPRERKGTIPTEGKSGVDSLYVHNGAVAQRKVEDSGDGTPAASAQRPSLREREKDCSGAMAGAQQNNRKKQGSRTKKTLQSIPEDVYMETKFVDQGSRIESEEEKEVLEFCAKEVRPLQGSVCAKGKDQCKLKTGRKDEQHKRKEPQQEKTATCCQTSRKRGGSSMLPPGHSTVLSPIQAPRSPLTTDCSSMPRELDSAHMDGSRIPSKPEQKKDEALNLRSSTRTRKIVYYNEQSPENDRREKKLFVTVDSKAKPAIKRDASAANLPSGAAKRVKEDPTKSTREEILGLISASTSCKKRGRRRQEPKLPRNLVDEKSCAAIKHTETMNDDEDFKCTELKQGNNANKSNSSASVYSLDFDKALLMQKALPQSSKSLLVENAESAVTSQAQGGTKPVSATKLEEASSMLSINVKGESVCVAHNRSKKSVSQKRSLYKYSQKQKMANESTSLEIMSLAAGEGVAQQHLLSSEISDEKSVQSLKLVDDKEDKSIIKERKSKSKQRGLPDAAQKTEVDLLDALPLAAARGNEEENSKVLEASLVQGAPSSQTGVDYNKADKRHHGTTQTRGRTTVTRKRILPGTTQQAKKLKVSESTCLDTLPLTASPKPSIEMLVEGAAPAQIQELRQVIRGVESRDWNAFDITNFKSKVVHSSEKKRREEFKRKRAMKFDALPVGFGLGISCWSPPPWPSQIIEEGVIGQVEVGDSVMDFQVESISPTGEAEKEPCLLQETAMWKDVNNISLGLEDVNTLPASHHALPCSATKVQVSTFSKCDAERLPGSGSGMGSAPKAGSKHRQEKVTVKTQAGQKTKTSKALLVASPSLIHTRGGNSKQDMEKLEPQVHVHNDESESKVRRSSRRRAVTSGREKTAGSKQ